MPQLLGGFGVLGAVAGAAFAILVPLVGSLFDGADASAKLAEEMVRTGGTIGAVESAVSALDGVQRQFNDAIRASGGASSGAAALVIANSAKEFEARKQILAVELELLRIRGAETKATAANLASGVELQLQGAMNDARDAQGLRDSARAIRNFGTNAALADQPPPPALASVQTGFDSVANAPGISRVFDQRQLDLLALRKLNAETALNDLTISQTEALMTTKFADIAVAADTVTTASGRAGGAMRGAAQEAAPALEATTTRLEDMTNALSDYADQAKLIGAGIGDALAGGFEAAGDAVAEFVKTGKLDVHGLVVSIVADMAKLAVQQAVLGPLAGALAGALGSGGGLFGTIGKVLAGKYHHGGLVGTGAPILLDARALEAAPRYHTGGGFGLRMDEQAAVLQKGERVLSRAQTRAYDGGGVTITINARDANSFRQSRAQIAADIARAVAAGRRDM